MSKMMRPMGEGQQILCSIPISFQISGYLNWFPHGVLRIRRPSQKDHGRTNFTLYEQTQGCLYRYPLSLFIKQNLITKWGLWICLNSGTHIFKTHSLKEEFLFKGMFCFLSMMAIASIEHSSSIWTKSECSQKTTRQGACWLWIGKTSSPPNRQGHLCFINRIFKF